MKITYNEVTWLYDGYTNTTREIVRIDVCCNPLESVESRIRLTERNKIPTPVLELLDNNGDYDEGIHFHFCPWCGVRTELVLNKRLRRTRKTVTKLVECADFVEEEIA